MNRWFFAAFSAGLLVACGQDVYSASVERHYAEHGSPRNVNHAIMTGYFINSEHGAALCDNSQCRYMLPVDTEQMSSECLNRIVEQSVAIIGSISNGRLTNLDSVHLPDNSVACVF
tara:strand:+ start:108 stop:455 length:348 start_codon:yes stop_codon:yes gene_type:complete